ncbi:biotin-dependent carboxyltransferase family protein [Mucilaginibacter lacusdianchii]|uniref:5-oxoprolinase subunit C family protein n=1 Tax=Mucilaginibacter lacusdianchii TaxID=2684211 RepID=UPI00131BE0CE|nr:biotin-dependent carboxyltransferase family protein [Mucilaginibacter sp. JXJ CY 39]
MQIRIIKPGILSTVQDLGRWNFLPQAVPVSGAMDALAARLANKVLGNDDNDAVIEFTYSSASFKAETDLLIAYSGDGALLKCDNQAIPTDRPVFVPAGNIVHLTNNPAGCRTYLAIAGGFDVPVVLGSRSTYTTAQLGGLHGRLLQSNDLLYNTSQLGLTTSKILNSLTGEHLKYPAWSLTSHAFLPSNRKIIRVVPGPEFTWFNSQSIINFLTTPFTLTSQSNRMGYQLEGPVINRRIHKELLSTAVTPGTIQVTGSGNPVLLMADCQTTGGYPRIAQVAAVDVPLCGQLKPGDQIQFEEISRQKAEMLYIEQEQQLQKLTHAIKSKYA